MKTMVLAFQVWLSKIPHLLYVLGVAFVGGVSNYLLAVPATNLVTALTTQAGLVAIAKGAAVTGLLAIVSILKPASESEVNVVKAARSFAKTAASLLILTAFAVTQAACNAQSGLQALIDAALTSIENGTTLTALEQLVVKYFPQYAGDAAAIDTILQAVISLLEASGVLPPAALSNARAIKSQLQEKLHSSRTDVQRAIASLDASSPITVAIRARLESR